MKILFLVSNLSYPPTEGAHAQTLDLIANLIGKGIEVKLDGFIKKLNCFDIEKLKVNFPKLNLGDFKYYSSNYIFLALTNLFDFNKSNDSGFDIIHFEGFGVITLIEKYRSANNILLMSLIDPWARRQRRRMVSAENVLKKLMFFISWKISFLLERQFLKQYNLVHLVSGDDLSCSVRDYPLANFKDIPIAFDGKKYKERKIAQEGKFKILFWGDLNVSYLSKGLDFFVNSVLHHIDNVELIVLGRMDKKKYFDLYNVNISNYFAVEFVDWVGDLEEFILVHDCVVLPDQNGTGLKNRTILSMMLGMPIIGSKFAFDGVAGVNEIDYFVCKTAEEYITACNVFQNDMIITETISKSANKTAMTYYEQSVVVDTWVDLYTNLMKNNELSKT